MPVRIRLMRMGSKRRPFYRFVVTDSRNKRDGGYLDWVGYYNPIAKPYEIKIDEEKVFAWLRKGAQISEGARSLLKKVGTLKRWDELKSGKVSLETKQETEEVSEGLTEDSNQQ